MKEGGGNNRFFSDIIHINVMLNTSFRLHHIKLKTTAYKD